MDAMNIGIAEPDREKLSAQLSRLLADTYTLYLTTHAFHWNVTGPMFPSLHLLFEQQYTELWRALDGIAERIRALGFMVPAGHAEFQRLSELPDLEGRPAAREMIQRLIDGHESVVRTARAVSLEAAAAHDDATVDLVTERLEAHEKAAWMLRALLED